MPGHRATATASGHGHCKVPPFVQAVRLKHSVRYRGYAQDPVRSTRVYSRLFDEPHDAYQAALRMRKVAADGVPGIPIGDVMDAVLREAQTKRAAGTVEFYADQFAAIAKHLPRETFLHNITRARLEQFIVDRRQTVGPSTVNKQLQALRRLFRVAIRMGLHTGENPATHVEMLRADSPPMDYFAPDELAALLARVTDQKALDLFTLFAFTGIRRSEASRIEPGHVRGTTLFVRGKRRSRVVPIAQDAAKAVERLAFPRPLKVIDETFRHWKRALGERKLHPHALRHTFGTALARQGERPDVIMHLMGHSNLQMTLRYLHECGAESAAAVGRLQLLSPRVASLS